MQQEWLQVNGGLKHSACCVNAQHKAQVQWNATSRTNLGDLKETFAWVKVYWIELSTEHAVTNSDELK